MPANPKLIDKLSSQLPPEGRRLFDAVIDCAGHYDMRAFLVGGPVRDLLLDRPALDIDVSVEGDAIMLANAVAREAEAKVAKRSEFGTAALKTGDFALDLATARAEAYPKPGRVAASPPVDDRRRPAAAGLHDQRDRAGAGGQRRRVGCSTRSEASRTRARARSASSTTAASRTTRRASYGPSATRRGWTSGSRSARTTSSSATWRTWRRSAGRASARS